MYEHILLPLDGSELAEGAIPHAEALARSHGVARISIVHVVDPGRYRKLALAGRPPASYLKRVAGMLERRGVEQVNVKALTGDPARAIMAYSEANSCDMIVMTSRAQRGIIGCRRGVAERVFRGSSVPVLSVRVSEGKMSRRGSRPGSDTADCRTRYRLPLARAGTDNIDAVGETDAK